LVTSPEAVDVFGDEEGKLDLERLANAPGRHARRSNSARSASSKTSTDLGARPSRRKGGAPVVPRSELNHVTTDGPDEVRIM